MVMELFADSFVLFEINHCTSTKKGNKKCEGSLAAKRDCCTLEIKNRKMHDLMANVTSISNLATELRGKLYNPNLNTH